MRRFAVLAPCVLLVAGCLDQAPPPAEPTGEPVAYRTLLVSAHAPVVAEGYQGELSPRDWNATWERYAAGNDPRAAKPVVDFSRERVFAVSEGPFDAGCHDVRIVDARIDGGMRTIWYDVYDGTGAKRLCRTASTFPTHVIALETDTYWSFASRTVHDEWPHAPWPGPQTERLAMRTLDEGSFSDVGQDARLVLRDAGAWAALWARHRPDEPAPPVDFAREMVVAVVEHGPTGCDTMRIGGVRHDPEAPAVGVTIVREVAAPEVSCLVAFEDLFHFVAVPARDPPALFEEVDEPQAPAPVPDEPERPPPTTAPLDPTPPTSDAPAEAEGPYGFRTLERGTASGIEERTRLVIRDADAWRAFWANHSAPFSPAPETPAVDWASERVFVATAGAKPNTCWSIRVERIEVRETSVNVEVATTSPPADAVCGQAVSHPFHYVTYPITDKPLFLLEAEG